MTIDLRAAVNLQRASPRPTRIGVSALERHALGSYRSWAVRAVVYARAENVARARGYRHEPVDVWLNR